MTEGSEEPKQVKFYGPTDFASYWQFERIGQIISQFDATGAPRTIADAIELYNVQLYIESGILPVAYSPVERAAAEALAPRMRAVAYKFIGAMDNTNLVAHLTGFRTITSLIFWTFSPRPRPSSAAMPESCSGHLPMPG
ncbi:hypothetical protein QF031_000048 [Pseudarthrobacter defluvii]|nr:hypothetical protein [Pseudarthrobacter defluvii]